MPDPVPTPAAPADDRVTVYNPSGRLVTIPSSQLDAAQKQGYTAAPAATSPAEEEDKSAYTLARERGLGIPASLAVQAYSPAGIQARAIASPFGLLPGAGLVATIGSTFMGERQAESLGLGELKGLTMGLGNVGLKKLAGLVASVRGEDPEQAEKTAAATMQARTAEFPRTAGAGEMGGMVAGSLLGGEAAAGLKGGLGLAARSTPLGLMSGAGEVAEGLAGRAAAGFGEGLAGQVARGALKMGARGALENAIYSGVDEMSEEMLKGDPQLNAEKILAATGHGALGGAIVGGALGAGGPLLSAGADAMGQAASKGASKLQELADAQRWRTLNARKEFTAEANARIPGGTKAVGEVLGRYGITGDSIADAAAHGDIRSISNKLDSAVDQVGQQIGQLHASSTAQIPLSKVEQAVDDVIAPYRKLAGMEPLVSSLETYKASLAEHLGSPQVNARLESGDIIGAAREMGLDPSQGWLRDYVLGQSKMSPADAIARLRQEAGGSVSIQDVLTQRKALDRLVYQETRALDPKLRVEAMRDVRRNLEGLIVDSFDEAARASGNAGAKDMLLGLKRDYQALSLAQRAADDSVDRLVANRAVSLSDYLTGGTMASVGKTVGGALGGAPGAFVGGIAGGAAGAAINKLARERGNAVAAALLDRLAEVGGASRSGLSEVGESLAREAAHAEGHGDVGKIIQDIAPTPSFGAEEAEAPHKALSEHVPAEVPKAARAAAPQAIAAPTWDKHLSTETMHKLGIDTLALPNELAEAGKQVFGDRVPNAEFIQNMYRAPPGYHVKVDEFGPGVYHNRVDTDVIHMHANIYKDDGMLVGQLRRRFMRDSEGNLVADHDIMRINPSEQGKGIGSELSQSAIEAYHQLGVKRIELDAALDMGPYAWARQGYQWKSEGTRDSMHGQVDLFAREYGLSEEETKAIHDAIDKEPRAVSELGRGTERHYGKDFLLGTGGWSGQMSVDAAHAEMMQKAAEFQRAQDAIKQTDVMVDKAARGIVEGPSGRTTPYRSGLSERSLKARFEEARDTVSELQANPQAAMQAVMPSTSKYMPKTSQALALSMMRGLTYLQRQVPTPLAKPSLGQAAPARVSVPDMHAFLERYKVVEDPKSALRAFAAGRMTVGMATALQEVSPQLFAELQAKTLQVVQDRQAKGDPLPYDARQRMHILLGIITDPSQDPKMAAALQANLIPEPKAPGGGAPRPSAPQTKTPGAPGQINKFDQLEES